MGNYQPLGERERTLLVYSKPYQATVFSATPNSDALSRDRKGAVAFSAPSRSRLSWMAPFALRRRMRKRVPVFGKVMLIPSCF
jgi:hypothetical protein